MHLIRVLKIQYQYIDIVADNTNEVSEDDGEREYVVAFEAMTMVNDRT